jgi:hypothetical protein
MEWMGALMGVLVLVVFVGPFVALIAGLAGIAFFAQFLPASSMVASTTFDCPFSKRRVAADFVSWPGADRPADVIACSAFGEPRQIRCKKECLELASVGSVSTPMQPRFSLVAGGVAYRH